jgi:hypothetical protein
VVNAVPVAADGLGCMVVSHDEEDIGAFIHDVKLTLLGIRI